MAIAISLGNGSVTFVNTIDELLNFDYQKAISQNTGLDLNNPMFDAVLSGEEFIYEEISLDIIIPDIEELEIEELDLDEEFE